MAAVILRRQEVGAVLRKLQVAPFGEKLAVNSRRTGVVLDGFRVLPDAHVDMRGHVYDMTRAGHQRGETIRGI